MKAPCCRYRHGAQAAALVVGGSLVLSACGSSHHSTTPTTSAASSTSPPAQHHHAATASTCRPALLQIKPTFGGAAAGGGYYRFSVTNTAPQTCTLSGYPSLAFFSPGAAGGAATGSEVAMTAADAGPKPAAIKLSTGQTGEFLLLFTDVPVNGSGCSQVASVQVTLPGTNSAVPVPISFNPCGSGVKVYPLSYPGTERP